MKEQQFKKQIAEIAAKIAEADMEAKPGASPKDIGDKLELPGNYRAKANAAIGTPKDMAQAVLDYMEEILANEKSMQDLETRAGWNAISQRLKILAGEKVGSSSGKPKDEEPPMPSLKESFDRINRK